MVEGFLRLAHCGVPREGAGLDRIGAKAPAVKQAVTELNGGRRRDFCPTVICGHQRQQCWLCGRAAWAQR